MVSLFTPGTKAELSGKMPALPLHPPGELRDVPQLLRDARAQKQGLEVAVGFLLVESVTVKVVTPLKRH